MAGQPPRGWSGTFLRILEIGSFLDVITVTIYMRQEELYFDHACMVSQVGRYKKLFYTYITAMSHSSLYTTTFVKRMSLFGNKFSLLSVQSVQPFSRHPQTVS